MVLLFLGKLQACKDAILCECLQVNVDGPPCEGPRPGKTEVLASFVAVEVAVAVTDSVDAAVVVTAFVATAFLVSAPLPITALVTVSVEVTIVTAPLAMEVVMTDSFASNAAFVVQSASALEKCQHSGSLCSAVLLAKLQGLQSCVGMFCTIW